VNGSEPVLVVAIGPVSAQFAPVAEPEGELPDADELVLEQQDDDIVLLEPDEELPVLEEPEGVHCGVLDAETLWTPDCP
jgi:hypothetical protein